MPWKFQIDREEAALTLKSGIVVGDLEAFLSCGLAGLEMLVGLRPTLQPFIDSGEFVEILSELRAIPKPVSVLMTDRRYLPPKVRVFMGRLGRLLPASV